MFSKIQTFCSRKMEGKIKGRNITITNSPAQIIHEISLEYDFSDPKFEFVQCNTLSHMPIFVATCEIQKEMNIYISMGEKSKTKKEAKHNSARKLLEILNRDYLFSEQTESENESKKPIENNFEKIMLYKWTGTCERCYQRGHKPVNCTAPKRNKKFIE